MKTKLSFLITVTIAVAVLLVMFRGLWSLQPLKIEDGYTNISRVTTDVEGAIYTITDSKQVMRKVNEAGMLVYDISNRLYGQTNTDMVILFDSLATDADGHAFMLITILDSYGLNVYGEKIVKISADGSRSDTIYNVEYDTSDQLLRVGKIQSLSVVDDYVYFFRNDEGEASLLRLSTGTNMVETPEIVRTIEMPSNRYLKELAGNKADQLFFTTKKGSLFSIDERLATQVYPNAGEEQLKFPVGIVTEDHTHLYFIDFHDEAIKAVNVAANGYEVKSLLTLSTLERLYEDVEWWDFMDISIADGLITVATSNHVISLNADGEIIDVQNSFRYAYSVMIMKLGYWLLIVLFVMMLFYTLRFVYIHVMKGKIYLLLKQLGVILPVVVLSMIGLSYSVYTSFSVEMKQETYAQLELLAGNGKYLVDGVHLEQLNSPRDYMGKDYLAIKQRIDELFSRSVENRDGLYHTIYRYMDGQLYIVMDDDDSVAMFQPFEVNEENLLVLEQGEVIVGEWEDSSGQWMYALGPLYNSNGEIIGIYEAGKDMIGVNQGNMKIMMNIIKIFVLISISLIVVITLMTVYLLSSIGKLRRNVSLFASGEWDVKVDIRTRDEVEELGDRFNMMAGSIRQYLHEVTKLSSSYFRFVPQQFLKVLGKTNMTEIHLGQQQNKQMTILVCNMRDFSKFSTQLTTEENFLFINSFLKQFGPIIREYGGFTSRYLGAGMLSLFPNDPDAALKAAMHLRAKLELYNEWRSNVPYEPIDIGISVHSGDVMLGIIGEEQRMEGSVVSNHVDLTLDLEKLSATLGVTILFTKDTLQMMKKSFPGEYRSLGAIHMNDEHPPMELYDLYEGDTEHIRRLKHETKEQFETAVEYFRNGRFYDAREGFVAVVKKNRHDLVAKLYFFECDRYFQEGVSAGWNNSLRIS